MKKKNIKKKIKIKKQISLLFKYSQVGALLFLSYTQSIQNMNRLLCVVCQEFHHQDMRAVNQIVKSFFSLCFEAIFDFNCKS